MADSDLVQILKEDGTVINPKLEPSIPDDQLKHLYYLMMLTRQVDDRFLRLQRQGRIGFFIISLGEEAAYLGSAFAMEEQDWIVPQYREPGVFFLRGVSVRDFACHLFGNAGDHLHGRQLPSHYSFRQGKILSISSPVGSQIPHGVGLAWAAKIRKDKCATLIFFGDGATSQGDFHVGMNFAGVFKVPAIFFCRNNQWAISVPLKQQTASESLAVKAKAYGIEGVRVDGNDILAVIHVTREAVKKARAGGGPTMIEAVTYRMSAHTTSDDPRIYRDEAVVSGWKEKDPLIRFQRYLERKKLWNSSFEEEIKTRITAEITQAIEEIEKLPPPSVDSMFEDVYTEMMPHIKEQQNEMRDLQEETHEVGS